MAGGVQERDLGQLLLAFGVGERNGVGADVLGDAAGFAGRHVGLADDIEQAGLAVVNMTHDRHDRRARDEVFEFVIHVQLHCLSRSMDQPAAAFAFLDLEAEAVFGADPLRHLLVNGLVDARKNARFHQVGDDLERLLLKLVRQVANDDRRLDGNDLGIGRQQDLRRGARWFGGSASAGSL